MSIQVIGLSGYARAGKDIVGQALVNRGWTRVSFADQIRIALYALNPLVSNSKRLVEVVDEYGWETAKTAFPEIRELLQRMGAEVGRDFIGEDTWINLALKNLAEGSKVVITDCRWPNEAKTIKNLGGQMWRVERKGVKPANAHKGEIALDDFPFDMVFYNNDSIYSLDLKIGKLLSELKLPNSNSTGETMNTMRDAGLDY